MRRLKVNLNILDDWMDDEWCKQGCENCSVLRVKVKFSIGESDCCIKQVIVRTIEMMEFPETEEKTV